MECSVIEWQLASNPKFKAAIEKHYVAKSDLRKLVERMELVATDKKWEDLDEGYRAATADWVVELKGILNKGRG